jgi:sarcosine oxidase subunit gamma
VVDLIEKTPCAGMLPLTIGGVTAREERPRKMTTLAPFKGRDSALAEVLRKSHGLGMPGPNRATGAEEARAIWFGQRMILLAGPSPAVELAGHAALVDQSDAWAVVRLEGLGAADVLARLTPLDLRDGVFKQGHTARTDLRHMMASITRIGADAWLIMVFRSFAETLVHDLKTAMETVAARAPSSFEA